MRSRSALWERLTKRGRFEMYTKAVINNTEYTAISAPVIDRALMSSPLSVGNCNAATLSLSVLTNDMIPSGSSVVIQGSVANDQSRGEWLPFGTFFIDQRDTSYEGLVTVKCYDALLKANQRYLNTRSTPEGWPKSMTNVVNTIAQRIGVELDSRTVINTGPDYVVPDPEDLTMIQILGYIAGCHGGNWIITEENKLRLVPLVSAPDETYYVVDSDYQRIQTDDGYILIHDDSGPELLSVSDANKYLSVLHVPAVLGNITNGKTVTVTGVSMEGENDESYIAGDDTGFVIELGQNPYATAAICDALFAQYGGIVYSPFTASDAIFDPAAELGDQIFIGDRVCSVIMAETITLDTSFRANISAPNNEELSKEYPYLSNLQWLIKKARILASDLIQLSSDLTAEIGRATAIETALGGRITALEGDMSALSSIENRLTALENGGGNGGNNGGS